MNLDPTALRDTIAALEKSLGYPIRSAAESGLITDVARFKEYRDKRNITGHTYHQQRAEEVVAVLESFLGDARFLLNELERRNRAED